MANNEFYEGGEGMYETPEETETRYLEQSLMDARERATQELNTVKESEFRLVILARIQGYEDQLDAFRMQRKEQYIASLPDPAIIDDEGNIWFIQEIMDEVNRLTGRDDLGGKGN